VLRGIGPLLLVELSGGQERAARPLRPALPPPVPAEGSEGLFFLLRRPVPGRAGAAPGWCGQGRFLEDRGPQEGAALRLLRGHGLPHAARRRRRPVQRKAALGLLDMALGRPSSHYNFLGHRPSNPIVDREQTASGRMVGKVQGGFKAAYVSPREPLKSGDLLRIGYEDQAGHQTVKIRRDIPKGGRLELPKGQGRPAPQGAPVFLVDRRERELQALIADLKKDLVSDRPTRESTFSPVLPRTVRRKGKPREMDVWRSLPTRLGNQSEQAVWLTPGVERGISRNIFGRIWWWLPPVIWPAEEKAWGECLENMTRLGARQFVLNAPWQLGLFDKPERQTFWAGPMCNTANPLALAELSRMGFAGAFVSPELDREGFLELPALSPCPLASWSRASTPVRFAHPLGQPARTRAVPKPQG
jgi:U32 family peptidase